jgi:hypothetical protein
MPGTCGGERRHATFVSWRLGLSHLSHHLVSAAALLYLAAVNAGRIAGLDALFHKPPPFDRRRGLRTV